MHSLWPCKPFWLRVLTATVSPVLGLAGAVVCSFTQPLNTQPNPPSPKMLSGRKFLVAILRSEKENLLNCRGNSSSREEFQSGVPCDKNELSDHNEDLMVWSDWSVIELFPASKWTKKNPHIGASQEQNPFMWSQAINLKMDRKSRSHAKNSL